MTVVSVGDVRRTCGITDKIMDDDDVSFIITEATSEVDNYLNTAVEPKTIIEYRDAPAGSTSTEILMLLNKPILQVKSISIDGTSVSPKYTRLTPDTGKLLLINDAEASPWNASGEQANIIKYVYGTLEETNTETTVTTAVTTPTTSYSITVASSAGIVVNDWVRIKSTDGYDETTKVTAVADTTHITVDLALPHEAASQVVLMRTPTIVKRLVNIIASLMLIARQVGASFEDIVGYGLGDENIQKGEPYTQWREAHVELEKERKLVLSMLRPLPAIAVA